MSRPVWAKLLLWLVCAGAVCILLAIFPPFHIVPLNEARQKSQARVMDPAEFASGLWQGPLARSFDNASDAVAVLDAIRRDRQDAKDRYGKVVGLGGPHHYFVNGTGRIIAVDKRKVELSLEASGTGGQPDIVLAMSMIFGNEVINATGLVSRSQFQKTNDYNAISAELNKIVEARVCSPFLERAKVGAMVRFIGCSMQVRDDDPMPIPMTLVPVKLEIE